MILVCMANKNYNEHVSISTVTGYKKRLVPWVFTKLLLSIIAI